MAKEPMERPSTSLINREMQTQTQMRLHYTSNGQKLKSAKVPDVGERYRSILPVCIYTDTYMYLFSCYSTRCTLECAKSSQDWRNPQSLFFLKL